MTPIGTIYQTDDGNYSVTSSVATPLALTRILLALTHAMLGQVVEAPAVRTLAVVPDEPAPVSDGDAVIGREMATSPDAPDGDENQAQAPA